jgi:curved DNA-binding protein CbpA
MRRPAVSPYVTLGVAADATEEQVRKAFRDLGADHHPDRQPPERREAASARFGLITEAYGILSDATARGQYDRAEPPYELADDAPSATPEGVPLDTAAAIEFLKTAGPQAVDVLLAADTGEPIAQRLARAGGNLVRDAVSLTRTPEGQAKLRGVVGFVWDQFRALDARGRAPPG